MDARVYGNMPYKVAVVHTGPGQAGSAAGLARGLAKRYGVIELLQSKDSLEAQIEEIREQLLKYTNDGVVLIGHGYGGWLAALFAAKYTRMVKKLVVIGAFPLDMRYFYEIDENRSLCYSDEQMSEYIRVMKHLYTKKQKEKQETFINYINLCKFSDDYQPCITENDTKDIVSIDANLHQLVYTQALQKIKDGDILNSFRHLKCPITIIHGQYDPHPVAGVLEPLLKNHIKHRFIMIDNSGHTPWRERLGYEDFYHAIFFEIEDMLRYKSNMMKNKIASEAV